MDPGRKLLRANRGIGDHRFVVKLNEEGFDASTVETAGMVLSWGNIMQVDYRNFE